LAQLRDSRLRSFALIKVASALANSVGESTALSVAEGLGRVAAHAVVGRAELVVRHQARAWDGPLAGADRRRAVGDAFASYGRYWVEFLRVGSMDPAKVAARFRIDGLEYVDEALARGRGAILAIPHVGGWDVGGAWFVGQGYPMTVVVEALEPPELREWFVGLRRSLGFGVVPLGPAAGTGVVRALRANRVVALLSDRDIIGGGVEVDFFGESTTLPAGPVALAKRLGAPLMATAIYFEGAGHHTIIRPPLDLDGDIPTVTQRLAADLEILIRHAPEQWHLFQPNWPSDRL